MPATRLNFSPAKNLAATISLLGLSRNIAGLHRLGTILRRQWPATDWRDFRVFVPWATIQNWVEAGGEKGDEPG